MNDAQKPSITPAQHSTDGDAAYEAVLAIAQRMHRGHHWSQGEDKAMRCVKAPLLKGHIHQHVNAGHPIGLCPIAPGESTTRIACLDMDSHKGEVPWDAMTAKARLISKFAEEKGLTAMPFRSTGGSGIHLIFMWPAPQDAHSVRKTLEEVLRNAGFESGTKGVAQQQVEIFPKQDAVPEDGYGSMFVLPMSRKSVPLDHETFDEIALPYLRQSAGVQYVKREATVTKASTLPPAELEQVAAAVRALPAQDYDYEHWRNIVFAIHSATGGSDDGLALAKEYNAKHPHERGEGWLETQVWPHIKDDGSITAGTLFHHAGKAGWSSMPAPDTEGFESVEPSSVDAVGPTGTDTGTEGFTASEGTTLSIPTYEDMTTLDLIPPEPRDWVVDGWLAAGIVHTLFARGGVGKSLISQQLATAVATGTPWLEMNVVQGGPVLGFFCEEDSNELRWRQRFIFKHAGLEPEHAGVALHLQARLGMDNVLMVFSQERKAKLGRFYKLIEQECERLRPRLLILDNVAQLFAGVENDRAMVTQFNNAIARLARRYSCAVLLLGHTAKAEASEFSGSTAWENVARVRWFLNRLNDGTSDLSIEKSNIGPRQKIAVNWQDHVFVRFDRATEVSDITVGARNIVLAAVREITSAGGLTDGGRAMSMFKSRPEYAPKVIVARGLAGGLEQNVIERAIGDLIGMGLLSPEAVVGRKANGQQRVGLGLTDQGLAHNPLNGNETNDLA
jgi:hypothetical protein